jgi:hypothetical protein
LFQNLSIFDPGLTSIQRERDKLLGDDGHCRVMTPGLRISKQTTQKRDTKYHTYVVLKQPTISATKTTPVALN